MAEDAREAEARRRRAEGDRVRAVREAIGERQPAFALRLTGQARKLGMIWLRYDNTIVSKLEQGTRDLSIDDTFVIAAIDPRQRGRQWLITGEESPELPDPSLDRKLNDAELDRATQAAAREAAEQKNQSKGKRRRGGA